MRRLAVALEVMDKEPNLAFVWLVFLVIGAGGYWGAKARGWLLAPALGVIALAVWVMLHDLFDRQVGPAIIEEAGWSYVIVSVLAALVAAAMAIAGFRSRKRAA
jgi:hypothetical protein